MDAVDFILQYRRMFAKDCISISITNSSASPEKLVSEVEKWAKENPIKTRQSLFLEQWPNAELDCQGVIAIDPCDVDKTMHGKDGDCYNGNCDECRLAFWEQEVE